MTTLKLIYRTQVRPAMFVLHKKNINMLNFHRLIHYSAHEDVVNNEHRIM